MRVRDTRAPRPPPHRPLGLVADDGARTLAFVIDELELLREVLREHLAESEWFVKRLERERQGAPTPLSTHVKGRCQRVRAILRRLTPEPRGAAL